MKKNSFKTNYKNIEFLCKKFYVWSANFYCWFWIIREIFWRKSTDFEAYLLWFFLSAGMYYFIRDNKDLDIIYNIDDEEKKISNDSILNSNSQLDQEKEHSENSTVKNKT